MLKNLSKNIKGIVDNSVISFEYKELKRILEKIKVDFEEIKKKLGEK